MKTTFTFSITNVFFLSADEKEKKLTTEIEQHQQKWENEDVVKFKVSFLLEEGINYKTKRFLFLNKCVKFKVSKYPCKNSQLLDICVKCVKFTVSGYMCKILTSCNFCCSRYGGGIDTVLVDLGPVH